MEADCEFCYLVVRELAFREYAERVRDWDEERERANHRTRFASQDFQVIQSEGLDVGILSTEITPDALKIFQLFFLPEHQGKGIGSSCMEHLIQEATQLRVPLRLQVINGNDRALSFYKKGMDFSTRERPILTFSWRGLLEAGSYLDPTRLANPITCNSTTGNSP